MREDARDIRARDIRAGDKRQEHFGAGWLRRSLGGLLLRKAANRFGRSIAIRVIDCGSSGAVEQEILAIFNPVYDAEQYGFQLAASPRHADVLLVSGPLTRSMEAALLATFEAMPDPRRVVTIGDAFTGQGIFGDS